MKLWCIEVKREIEDKFVGHMSSENKPTTEEVIKWLAEEHYIEDDPEYTEYKIREVGNEILDNK